MIKYIPSSQLSIEEFQTPFDVHLDKRKPLGKAGRYNALGQAGQYLLSVDEYR